jgi:hypothetical protein
MAVTMKNGVFWDVTPCTSCVKRHFGERIAHPFQGKRMEAIVSSETSVPTRATRRNIPEDVILHYSWCLTTSLWTDVASSARYLELPRQNIYIITTVMDVRAIVLDIWYVDGTTYTKMPQFLLLVVNNLQKDWFLINFNIWDI